MLPELGVDLYIMRYWYSPCSGWRQFARCSGSSSISEKLVRHLYESPLPHEWSTTTVIGSFFFQARCHKSFMRYRVLFANSIQECRYALSNLQCLSVTSTFATKRRDREAALMLLKRVIERHRALSGKNSLMPRVVAAVSEPIVLSVRSSLLSLRR